MPRYYFEDFHPGAVFEVDGPSVTREEIIEFASRYDPQPFHVDEAAAKNSFYGGLIASGWQTAGLCMRMICESYLLDAASMGSPGIDELRWTKPVRPGDQLRMKMIVLEAKISRSRPEMGAVRHRWEVYNQNDEIVLHMTGWGLFARRTS